ncbi:MULTISPECIES: ATP-dependent nuclease [Enterobacteriaceae]|nr:MULTISPECIES: AAA family ATPase [Enterobacteriaceae]EIW8643596.1 chromosome segregation protein SMC [Klebsiella pneumoniae]QIV33034.1 AAA family ATPase [Klebsiella pneumoniae]HBR0912467.1 AAA family ATPase [Klebsiella pneumoniae]HBR1823734.1 AAA family ATPase [Klebsiella pneumoniae]
MYINKLSIRNYKNFRNSNFYFVKNSVNTIIGENASGKTNLFNAIRLILDDSLPMNSRILLNEDFHRGIGEPFGHWIIITLHFDDLGESEEEQVLANYMINDGNDKSITNGNYTFVFRPKFHIRQKLYELTTENATFNKRRIAFKELISNNIISKETYEAVAFVRTKVDFNDNGIYETIVGDFNKFIFPNPNDDDAGSLGIKKPPYFALGSEVACTYVKALRNVVADLKYYKTNPLYKLLTLKSKQIDDRVDIVENVKAINSKISSIPEIERLSNKISSSLINTVGSTYSPKILVSSQLPEDFTELIQSLGLVVEDSLDYDGSGRIDDLSLGGANLIYLALKLYEYEEIRDSEDHITHFLLIEEPEAHIHTHIQKTLFDNFNFKNTQVFVSTHSTQISSVSKISSMNILSRQKGYTDVYQPSNGLKPKEISSIERYLDAIRSDILFAKSVILVEGDAELILIPAMVKATLGISLDELGISLIKVDGTVFTHLSNLFNKHRLKRKCAILTDLDSAYVKESDEIFDEEFVKSLVNAEVVGLRRKVELDNYTSDNEFVNAYYATNTFETELIKYLQNKKLFISVMKTAYKQEANYKKAVAEISSTDKRVRYKRALMFANKIGKGWLATSMVEHLNFNNRIPDYILSAVKFALGERELNTIYEKILSYNMSCIGDECEKEFNRINNKPDLSSKLIEYKKCFSDTFVRFMEL